MLSTRVIHTSTLRKAVRTFFGTAVASAALSCPIVAQADNSDPITGVWFVRAAEAPFTHHVFMFNRDGTMHQANPDAGTVGQSASDGMGIWTREDGRVIGKFIEVVADRSSTRYVSRGEISYEITVEGDTFTGTASAVFYNIDNLPLGEPMPTPLEGTRVVLP